MARLIDADDLIKTIPNTTANKFAKWSTELLDREYVIKLINDAPTIDAVEVVRCENCKHYKPSTVVSHKMCFRKDVDGVQVCYDFKPDDFCRYGERKEDETD